ncbi:MAG TPA: alginate export family protein, partial [Caulobacteraceae bacterium]|nr:alginate export family protein [Caulobacteraceae bacterium]
GASAQTAAPAPDVPAATSEPDPAPASDGLGEEATSAPPPEAAPAPPPPAGPATISDAIAAGKLILEVRGRYEFVDQANLALHAKSVSVRTRIGWESADWRGFKALLEFEDIRHLDNDTYNVAVPGGASLNGKTQYPIVNDPEVTELNRAQLTWTPSPMLTVTGGRQRILIDDQRFVGNVGWRQDEQTFDGVRADFALGRFKATYAYVSHVNRIFGEKLDWRSDSHLINATYALAEPLRLEGFVYALDFSNSPTNSSLTWGARGSGKVWAGLVQVAYDATFARQSDYRHNTASYSLDYWQASVAATYDIFTLKGDYESLEGNGTRGFTTPLATTHAFQGWADAFAANGGNKTHVDGLRDFNVGLTLKPRWRWTYLFNIEAIVRYHDFDAERTGASLAHEWDAQVQAAINPKLTAAIKYANYRREPVVPAGTTLAPPSRTKLWLTLEYKL